MLYAIFSNIIPYLKKWQKQMYYRKTKKKTNRFLRCARSRVLISPLPFRYSGCVSSSSFKCSITRLLSSDDIKLVRLVNWKMPKRSMNDENADYSRMKLNTLVLQHKIKMSVDGLHCAQPISVFEELAITLSISLCSCLTSIMFRHYHIWR